MHQFLFREIIPRKYTLLVRFFYGIIFIIAFPFVFYVAFIVVTYDPETYGAQEITQPFPYGVYPTQARIEENTTLEDFIERSGIQDRSKFSFTNNPITRWVSEQAHNTALVIIIPHSKRIVIYPGERKEEIAQNFSRWLGWNRNEQDIFIKTVLSQSASSVHTNDGQFYPGYYIVPRKAKPNLVATFISERFNTEIVAHYNKIDTPPLSLHDTLIIASLIQREAYAFEDARIISGVIWNRIFNNMALQLDATLQYVRGGKPNEPEWWPTPTPNDKFLNSPFNTYQNKGIPPEPIANPSREMILAALNPKITDCLFYFHESRTQFHCSQTYEEHVRKLSEIYGTNAR